MAEKKKSDDLKKDIAKAEKDLEAAKEAHIEAGDKLEAARAAFLDERGKEAEAGQVDESK
jgi:hypothetical protein